MFAFTALLAFAALATQVSAHGAVTGVSSPSGGYLPGPNPYYGPAPENSKTPVRMMPRNEKPDFARLPYDYRDANAMACSRGAAAPASLNVKAGETVSISWKGATGELDPLGKHDGNSPWVHAIGIVVDHIAACNGDCASADPGSLSWVKLAQWGMDTSAWIGDDLRNLMAAKPEAYKPSKEDGPGKWGLAKLIEDGSQWHVTVPAGLRPGNYIIRNEPIAMHNPLTGAGDSGFQHYPACVQISVTEGGDLSLPAGQNAGQFYDPESDFARFNVYSNPYGLKMPSPEPWSPSQGGGSPAPAPAPEPSPSPAPAPAEPSPEPTPSPAEPSPEPSPEPSADSTPTPTPAEPTPSPESTPEPTTSSAATDAPAPTETRKCRKRPTKRTLDARASRMHRRRVAHDVTL